MFASDLSCGEAWSSAKIQPRIQYLQAYSVFYKDSFSRFLDAPRFFPMLASQRYMIRAAELSADKLLPKQAYVLSPLSERRRAAEAVHSGLAVNASYPAMPHSRPPDDIQVGAWALTRTRHEAHFYLVTDIVRQHPTGAISIHAYRQNQYWATLDLGLWFSKISPMSSHLHKDIKYL